MGTFLIWVVAAGLAGHAIVNLAAFAAVCVHYYKRTRADGIRFRFGGLVRHALPTTVLHSRWTYIDIVYYVMQKASMALFYPVIAALTVIAAASVQLLLRAGFGNGPDLSLNALTLSLFLIGALLTRDFVSFYTHKLQHQVPLLWEFHKVHHAPETLIPLTGHRLHPLEEFSNHAADAPALGLFVGLFAWLSNQEFDALILYSVGLQTVINVVTFSPLRHSHIDLRFGWFERFVLSPAHHRLHHSIEREHWDKNFSSIFPFWDAMWHTLLAPPPIDSYRIGLPDGQSAQYTTVSASYFHPFRSALGRAQAEGWRTLLRVGTLFNTPPRTQTADAAEPVDGVDLAQAGAGAR